ncbi:uncharacterized protein LACBIDRAFT_314636 [Laccaria bicolor S238N-H82]|uniref:Predicted protein n=1 Tax=Laccaria bicolor (strain S238N-H82 / ATCC MYA-4686) TaxID=486041 RepID=B0DYX8_LACBS|nr:uncharacterized protein LACBIDRAFT_314636 [Laccaria bicolor S238N-H82]EDR00223.1 predicted protein [Laccaria bicolor S238N-H82]|eukprot:XP_001889132.1 predicted protein [Laccaria bicolor S238N-H82]
MSTDKGFDMVEHISKLRKLQEELHLMENSVCKFSSVRFFAPQNAQPWTATGLGTTQILREPNQTT